MTPVRLRAKEEYRKLFAKPRRAIATIRNAKEKLRNEDLHSFTASLAVRSNPFHAYVSAEPTPKTYSAIRKPSVMVYGTDLQRELDWHVSVILAFKQVIDAFLTHKTAVDDAIIGGDYPLAETLLKRIEGECGFSYWSLAMRFLVRELQHGLSANTSLLAEVSNAPSVNGFVAWLMSMLSMRAERSVSSETYRIRVRKIIASLKPSLNTENDPFGRYLTWLLDPSLDRVVGSSPIKLLYYDLDSPIIDRYNSIIHVCLRLLTEGRNRVEVSRTFDQLSSFSADSRIAQAISYVSGEMLLVPPRAHEFFTMLDRYTVGNYDESEALAAGLIKSRPSLVEPYEIYLRSRGHRRLKFEPVANADSLSHGVLEAINQVYSRGEQFTLGVEFLQKTALRMGDASFSHQIAALVRYHTGSNFNPESARLTAVYAELPNPQLSRVIPNPEIADEYLRSLARAAPNSDTVMFYMSLARTARDEQSPTFSAAIPEPRRLLYTAEALYNAGRHHEAIALIERGLATPPQLPSFIFRDKATRLLFNAELGTGNFAACAEIAVRAFEGPSGLAACLPISVLCRRIEERRNSSLAGDINVPLLWFYHFKEIRKVYTGYDNFLSAHGFRYPSQLLASHNVFPPARLQTFLRDVCTMKVMSRSHHFTGTASLEAERLKLCQFLAENDAERREDYVGEINDITQKMVIREGMMQLDESKIYVDEAGIRNSGEQYFRQLYERLSEYMRLSKVRVLRLPDTRKLVLVPATGQPDVLVKRLTESGLQIEEIQLHTDPVDSQFVELFLDIRDRFIWSKEHGLNSYLSVRIRHGTLQGQIRSSFDSAHLISQRESPEHEYSANPYWEERLGELTPAVRAEIQLELAKFSAQVDSVTKDLKENVIQVRTETRGLVGKFDYGYTGEDLARLFATVFSKIETYEDFIKQAYRVLWERTEENLRQVREYIATQVKDELYGGLNRLHDAIREQVKAEEAPELLASIKTCQTDVQNECDRVARWFSVSNTRSIGSFDMGDIIRISVASINNLYPSRKLHPDISTGYEGRYDGRFLTQFSDIFRTLLENTIIHSGISGNAPRVAIVTTGEADQLTIEISNDLSKQKRMEDPAAVIRKNWGDPLAAGSDESVTKEGGTGLRKVAKIVTIDLDRKKAVLTASYPADNRLRVQLTINTDGLTVCES